MSTMTRRPRSIAAALTTLAVSLTGALYAGVAAPGGAHAAESTTTVQFDGCEVRNLPYADNTRIGGETTWSPSLRLVVPSPIPARELVTTKVQLGALPGGTLPISMQDVKVQIYPLELINDATAPMKFFGEFKLPTLDHTQPLAFPELEYNDQWPDAGIFSHRVKSIFVLIAGEDTGGNFAEFSFACDQVINAQPVLTTAVYDLAATPALVVEPGAARQGGAVHVRGTHLLAAAPTNPPAHVTVTIGGVAVGAFPVDESGAFSAHVQVPAYVAPGAVTVTAANGPKAASAGLTVTAAAGKVKAGPKKVKQNKAVTLSGSSFMPGEKVKLTLKGKGKSGRKSFAKTVKANASGAFKVKVKMKKAVRGTWKVNATGSSSKRKGATRFKVK